MDDNATLKATVEQLQKDVERHSSQNNDFYRRLSEIETKIAIQDERYTNLLQSNGRIENSVERLNASLEELKSKPAKRWDTVISCLITGVVSMIIGYIFNGLM